MNKKTKGLVALAAGAALFAGTAGTFALWFDAAELNLENAPIATGDLHLGVVSVGGGWVWSGVSHTNSSNLLGSNDAPATKFLDTDLLVPGDRIEWAWTSPQIEYFLAGTTIVAELWLDGVEAPLTANDLAPLTLAINWNEGSSLVLEPNSSSVLIQSDLSATFNDDDESGVANSTFEPPTFTLTFTPDYATNLINAGVGHAPDSTTGGSSDEDGDFVNGSGYGRNRADVQVIDISNLQVRLQQVPTSAPSGSNG